MVTANVPSAKKLIVHGPDLSCIPSQFPIQEVRPYQSILTVHVLCLCTFRCRLLRLYVYPHLENGKIWQSTFTVSDCWQKTSGKIRISF